MMILKPMLGATMSGSIGGLLASHGGGSTHLQVRGLRSNRRTQEQQVVRGAVSSLTASWETGLSDLQRDSWRTYAANVASTNRIGEDRHTSGMMMFVRANVSRLQIQADRIDEAPAIFNRAELTPPALIFVVASSQGLFASFFGPSAADPWRSQKGSFLIMFVGTPQNSGIQRYRGSYRFAGSVEGDPIFEPTFIVAVSPFRFAVGQRVFVRFEASYVDGRYTSPTFDSAIAG